MKLPIPVAFAVLATVSAILVPPAIVAPSSVGSSSAYGWLVEVIAYHGGSAPPALDIDTQGRPHVMYCPPGEAWYAVRENGNWTRELLTETPFGGVCGELAIGPGGEPHVMTPIALGVGTPLYGVKAGFNWTFEATDIGSVEAVDSLGRPHSAYLVRTGPNRVALEHVWRDGVWKSEEVEAFNTTATIYSRWVSFRLDATDRPHILYYEDARGDIRYAFRDATGWHVEVVEHVGFVGIAGKEGALALDSQGNPNAVYTVRTAPNTGDVKYAKRQGLFWTQEVVSPPSPTLGGGGFSPTIAMAADIPVVAYVFVERIDPARVIFNQSLLLATKAHGTWSSETVISGFWNNTIPRGRVPQFPSMRADACGNPHVVLYLAWWEGLNGTRSGVYYATKGTPCESPARGISLRVEPRTLNLESHGQWVSARITVENATSSDIDPASLALNGVPVARVEVLNNTRLMAKFDRHAFASTVQPGESIVVTLAGGWRDGGSFTATDVIRVIDLGGAHGRP